MASLIAGQPPRAARWLALAGLLLATLGNLRHLAWWCVPLLACIASWHARAAQRGSTLPGVALRVGAVLLLVVANVATVRHHGPLTGFGTLLASMAAAKLLEARARRDWHVLAGASLFLAATGCLDLQQLAWLPLHLASLWATTAALRGFERLSPPRVGELLRADARQLLLAVPLALVLFLFVPRLPGGFWALPGEEDAITGLADEMTPGDIARLVESDAPALRVRFRGALPPPGERYWRGPVLHEFDGATWRRGSAWLGGPRDPGDANTRSRSGASGPRYAYTLTLEPSRLPNVPALQYLQAVPPPLWQSADGQLLMPRPPGQSQSFELESWPRPPQPRELGERERKADLRLPANRNPRTLALAQRLRAAAASDDAYVQSLLAWFRDGGYTYTLEPQPVGRDSVDDLLFGTRAGFCGHYASAFVALARAGGVPARVVTGYLGGEWNRYGAFLLVRAAEAHAWAEAWLPGRGWVRTDPTAMVSPGRLLRGAYDQENAAAGGFGLELQRDRWLATPLQLWQAAGAWWQDHVVGFNYARQSQLLRDLGFDDARWQLLAALLGAGLVAWSALLAWGLRRDWQRQRPDAIARAWFAIEARLRRRGLVRAPQEGVADFSARVGAADSRLGAALAPLARDYLALRYGPGAAADAQARFVRAARVFRAAP